MPSNNELLMMQHLPFFNKVAKTKLRIAEWYEHYSGDVYVSFSGGKDSTVLLDICRKMYPDIEAVFSDTGLEYPEIRNFVNSYDNVTILHPEMNFKKVVLERGYPVVSKEVARAIYYARKCNTKSSEYYLSKFNGTLMYNGKPSQYNMTKWKFLLDAPFEINSVCCDIMKKRPFHTYERQSGKKAIVGTMTHESRLRQQKWIQHGCNAFDSKKPQSTPLAFWTEQDILTYLLTYLQCSVLLCIRKYSWKW